MELLTACFSGVAIFCGRGRKPDVQADWAPPHSDTVFQQPPEHAFRDQLPGTTPSALDGLLVCTEISFDYVPPPRTCPDGLDRPWVPVGTSFDYVPPPRTCSDSLNRPAWVPPVCISAVRRKPLEHAPMRAPLEGLAPLGGVSSDTADNHDFLDAYWFDDEDCLSPGFALSKSQVRHCKTKYNVDDEHLHNLMSLPLLGPTGTRKETTECPAILARRIREA